MTRKRVIHSSNVKKKQNIEDLLELAATYGQQFQVKMEKLETSFQHEEHSEDNQFESSNDLLTETDAKVDTGGEENSNHGTEVHQLQEESTEDERFQWYVQIEPIDKDLSEEENYCELDSIYQINEHIEIEDIKENVIEGTPRVVEIQDDSRVQP